MFRRLLPLILSLFPGCLANANEHPPELDCSGGDCTTDNATVSNGNGSGSGGESAGGAGAGSESGSAGAAGHVTVSGQIVEVDEPTFSVRDATTAIGTFTVAVPGADGKDIRQTSAALFSVEGVRAAKTLWLTAKPATGSDLLTGVIALNTTRNVATVVPVVRESALQLVAYGLTLPLSLSKDKGQVVLRFVDGAGRPVKGIAVRGSGTENVAYDDGASYSDVASSTGARGLAFLLNVNATVTPTAIAVALSGTASAEFAIWTQAGAASVLELAVSGD